MSILTHSQYNPARGGHAPGDIRDAFLEAIEAFENWEDGESEPTVEVRDSGLPISQVCGLLWNCTDILPGAAVTSLGDLDGDDVFKRGSYAGGSRFLRERIAGQPRIKTAGPARLRSGGVFVGCVNVPLTM